MKLLTEVPFLLLGTLASTCLFLMGWFRFQNRKLEQVFLEKVKRTNEMIAEHTGQIAFRQKGLNTYDFILRNLKEALKIQKDIEV